MFSGKKIKEKRKEMGLSQEQLGELIGVTKVAVWGYENGTKTPKIENFLKIMEVLNLTPDELLERDVNVICEGVDTYSFKISRKEMELIKALRKNTAVRNKLYKEFDIK